MKVKLRKAGPNELKNPPQSMSGVVFGTQFSDHMFSMEWEDGKGWHNAEIKPYGPLLMEPSSIVISASCFEHNSKIKFWSIGFANLISATVTDIPF